MPLHPVYGHEQLREALTAAVRSGRFPSASVFTGPAGVGKQRLALWAAAAILCEQGNGDPCGSCGSCVQISMLSHPDVHWFVPFRPPRKKAGDPEKQIDEAADSIGDVLAERREKPFYGAPEPTASHPIASARLLQRRVSMRPFQGQSKVIIVGHAERLIVQESSQEAANSLLKVLEEPPAGTYMILTTPSPQNLLPTIRSRLVPIRVAPVPDDVVSRFAREQLSLDERRATASSESARGRIGSLMNRDGGRDRAAESADRLLKTVKRGAAQWVSIAMTQPPWGARAEFTELLDAANLQLRRRLIRQSQDKPEAVPRLLEAIRVIGEFREDAQRNVNPQLGLAVLARKLGEI